MEETLLKLNTFMKMDSETSGITTRALYRNGDVDIIIESKEHKDGIGEIITNAQPTGDDCNKCGNPNVMYWCDRCEHNQEGGDYCVHCKQEHLPVDTGYHDGCNENINI